MVDDLLSALVHEKSMCRDSSQSPPGNLLAGDVEVGARAARNAKAAQMLCLFRCASFYSGFVSSKGERGVMSVCLGWDASEGSESFSMISCFSLVGSSMRFSR